MVVVDPPTEIVDRSIVAAITHDHARVWLLEEGNAEPIALIERPLDAEHRRSRPAEIGRGHHSEIGELPWYSLLEHVLGRSKQLILIGHGKGKGNEVDRFMGHLAETRSPLLGRVVGTGIANLPAMTDSEIISAARERWLASYL